MKYYLEINLLPNDEIPVYFLWQKLLHQIHIALADNKNPNGASAIGLGVPEHNAAQFSLGTRLRLFAEEEGALEKLQCEKWLNRLSDYMRIGAIHLVPEQVRGYACFKHIKLKGNKEKLARRRAKRKGETFEQALAYYSDYEEQRSRLPYINMTSQTNGQHFRLFIEKQHKEQEQKGLFSCYGLSNSSTVPLF
jgi:CRISPR-associated endonuclease Csy4